jgi:hypothetical protein
MLPSDRILKHHYRARNYQHYSELVQDLLQEEKCDKLTMRNNYQCPIGTTPLPKANYSSKRKEKVDGQNNHQNSFGKSKKDKRNKHKKSQSKEQSLGKGKKLFKCHRYGGPNHIAKKCNIPQHLVDLYQKSLKEARKAKGSFETHFNVSSHEATTLGKITDGAAKPSMTFEDFMCTTCATGKLILRPSPLKIQVEPLNFLERIQ